MILFKLKVDCDSLFLESDIGEVVLLNHKSVFLRFCIKEIVRYSGEFLGNYGRTQTLFREIVKFSNFRKILFSFC